MLKIFQSSQIVSIEQFLTIFYVFYGICRQNLTRGKGGRSIKYYVSLHGGGKVKNRQNCPYVINGWPLASSFRRLSRCTYNDFLKVTAASQWQFFEPLQWPSIVGLCLSTHILYCTRVTLALAALLQFSIHVFAKTAAFVAIQSPKTYSDANVLDSYQTEF